MSRPYGSHRWTARLRGAVLVIAAFALLAGCTPLTATVAPANTSRPPAAPTAAITYAPAVTAGATAPATTPTGAPASAAVTAAPAATTPPAQTPATQVPAPSARPSAAPSALATVPATPAGAGGTGIVIQAPDNSIKLVAATGQQSTLYATTFRVDMLSIFPPGNVMAGAVYVPLSSLPPSVVRVGASGGQPVSGIGGAVYGIAASAAGLAYGVADLNAKTSAIYISNPDGTGAKAVYQESNQGAPRVLRVMRWSPDGKHVYFGKEPVGLGGYILFGGLTNLWELDPATGKTAELIRERGMNAAFCIDDVSPDGALAADHCNPQAMEVIEVATKQALAVKPPADVSQPGAVGGARFSPDGLRLAYGLARRNPDNEQGWVAVSDVWSAASSGASSAPSRLIATSPANDYFSVVGWLDAQTLILQSGGQKPGVWSVGADGAALKRVADGFFLGILTGGPSAPAASAIPGAQAAQSCGELAFLGPNRALDAAGQQALDCFWQAYQGKKAASLKVTIAGVDAGIIHQFTLTPGGDRVRIQDSAAHYVAPRPPAEPDVVTCTGLARQPGGLVFQGCGDQGDVEVPPAG